MGMTSAEKSRRYRERQREAAGRAPEPATEPQGASEPRYELAYGADGTVIAWRALGASEWVLGPGPTGEGYERPRRPSGGVSEEGESGRAAAVAAIAEIRARWRV